MRALLAIALLFAASAGAGESATNSFAQGNRAFHLGQLDEAIEHYQKQIDSGRASAAVHFNLANAAFHDGRLGRAIFHYRRAQSLAPRDADVAANLKLARDAVHNGTPPKTGLLQRLTGKLTMNEWALLAGIPLTLWLAWLALINFRPAWQKAGAIFRPVLGAIALMLSVVALIAFDLQSNTYWVVAGKETTARFGPVAASPDQFKWFDGAELSVDRVHNDWVYARDATGRQGWIPTSDVLHRGDWHRSILDKMFGGFSWVHWILLAAGIALPFIIFRMMLKKILAPKIPLASGAL